MDSVKSLQTDREDKDLILARDYNDPVCICTATDTECDDFVIVVSVFAQFVVKMMLIFE